MLRIAIIDHPVLYDLFTQHHHIALFEHIESNKADIVGYDMVIAKEGCSIIGYQGCLVIIGEQADKKDAVYFSPPFLFRDLYQMVASFCKEKGDRQKERVHLGEYLFSPKQQVVTKAAIAITLTDKETAIIQALYEAQPHALSKASLLKRCWGSDQMETHTLETHMYRLRKKCPGLVLYDKAGYMLPSSQIN